MFTRSARLAAAFVAAGCCLAHCAGAAQDSGSRPAEHARQAPAWMDSSIVYEVYPRDFSPEGTLNGVTAQLDRLQKLGVNVLWIMPVHPVGAVKRLGALGSPYSPRDYYAIDPALGTKEDFANLVLSAHRHSMRVILDMVADHTSWDSPLMSHKDFYTQDAQGNIISPHGWGDVAGLNYANPALRRYMIDMFVYWLKTFDLDGFRCDAATYVPTQFWDELRNAVDKVRPDVLLLAEASKPDLMTKAFDLDYGWPLLAAFNSVIEDGQPATSIQKTWQAQAERFPVGTQHLLISDDHDERRAIVRYGERATLAASALVFTLPGVPMLYNGMEVGDATPSGAPALFGKLTIDWGASQQERAFPGFYHALIRLHSRSPALQHGDLKWLHNSDEEHVVSFERHSGNDIELVAVNLSNTPFRGTVEAAPVAGQRWTEVVLPQHGKVRFHGDPDGDKQVALPAISLDAFQVRVFRLTPDQP